MGKVERWDWIEAEALESRGWPLQSEKAVREKERELFVRVIGLLEKSREIRHFEIEIRELEEYRKLLDGEEGDWISVWDSERLENEQCRRNVVGLELFEILEEESKRELLDKRSRLELARNIEEILRFEIEEDLESVKENTGVFV